MELFVYVATLLISFLGIITGVVISNIAFEELPSTLRYLKCVNSIIIPIILFLSTYNFIQLYAIIPSLAALVLLLIYKDITWHPITYSITGAIFYVSTINNTIFVISILLFIYGTLIAAIISYNQLKNRIKPNKGIRYKDNINIFKTIIYRYCYYIVVAIALFALFEWII